MRRSELKTLLNHIILWLKINAFLLALLVILQLIKQPKLVPYLLVFLVISMAISLFCQKPEIMHDQDLVDQLKQDEADT